jgi:hypothetical protein
MGKGQRTKQQGVNHPELCGFAAQSVRIVYNTPVPSGLCRVLPKLCGCYNNNPCSIHCRIGGCAGIKIEGSIYCQEHKCPMNLCKNRHTCREHTCNKQNCNKLRRDDSMYCKIHACFVYGCENTTTCVKHTCRLSSYYGGPCGEPLIDGVRCSKHSCNIENCATLIGDCGIHRCIVSGCRRGKFLGGQGCDYHTCKINNCTELMNSCFNHRCRVSGCTSVKAKNSDLCFRHKCLYGNCSLPKMPGIDYCHWHRDDLCIDCGAQAIFSRDPERQIYGSKDYCRKHAECVVCKHKHRLFGQKTCGRHPNRVRQDPELSLPTHTPDSRDLMMRRTSFVLSRRLEDPYLSGVFELVAGLNSDLMIELRQMIT